MGTAALDMFRRRFATESPSRQAIVARVQTRLQSCESVHEVVLRENTVHVRVTDDGSSVVARLPVSMDGFNIVVEKLALESNDQALEESKRTMRKLSGLVEHEMAQIDGMFVGGADPTAFFRIYTILPRDLTTLFDQQHDQIEKWLSIYPMPMLMTRMAELERELNGALSVDNQQLIRNAQIKLRHVTNAMALQDRAGEVTESALSRHTKQSKRWESIANRAQSRGYTLTAEEMRRRAAFHQRVVAELREKRKRGTGKNPK